MINFYFFVIPFKIRFPSELLMILFPSTYIEISFSLQKMTEKQCTMIIQIKSYTRIKNYMCISFRCLFKKKDFEIKIIIHLIIVQKMSSLLFSFFYSVPFSIHSIRNQNKKNITKMIAICWPTQTSVHLFQRHS